MDEFLSTAQLAATDFTAGEQSPLRHRSLLMLPLTEKKNVKIISAPGVKQSSAANPFLLSADEEKAVIQKHMRFQRNLGVPRRPPWTRTMTSKEIDRQEKEAFLDWRRTLAQ